jgi:hypothetical protein
MYTLAYFGKDRVTKKKVSNFDNWWREVEYCFAVGEIEKASTRRRFDKTFVPYFTLLRNKLERLTMKNITIGFEPGSPY